jgi:hypothetical protein
MASRPHQVDDVARVRQAPESYDRLSSPIYKPSNDPAHALFDNEA